MRPSPSSHQPGQKRRRLSVVYLIPDTRAVTPLSASEENRGEAASETPRPFIDVPATGPIKSHARLTLEEANLEQDPEISKRITIPMMVLTSIAQQQKQP